MDLGWTQAQWNALFEKMGAIISPWYFLKRVDEQIGSGRISLDKFLDDFNVLSDWDLSGLILGNNTDAEGIIWVTLAIVGPNLTVSLYKDSVKAAPDLVAQGTIVAASAPAYIALAEQNSSGLSGTVYAASSANDSDIFLACTPGIFNQIDVLSAVDEVDTSFKQEVTDRLGSISASSLLSRIESVARRQLMDYIKAKIGSTQTAAGGGKETVTEGVVAIENEGIVGDLIDAMNDETVAGVQVVNRETIFYKVISVAAADADNTGKGSLAIDFLEHLIAGRYTLECTSGLIGLETFKVAVSDLSGKVHSARNSLTVNCDYQSIDLGLKDCKLSRTIEDSDAGSGLAAKLSDWAFQGEDDNNTNSGVLYGKVVSALHFYLYSNSSLDDRYEVAYGLWDGVPGSTVTLIEKRNSGLTGSFKVNVNPLGSFSDLQVDLNPFVEEDKFYFEVKKVGNSFWNEFFGKLFKANLPSGVGIDYFVAHRGYSGLTMANFGVKT